MVRKQKSELLQALTTRPWGGGSLGLGGWLCGSRVGSWFVIGSGARLAVLCLFGLVGGGLVGPLLLSSFVLSNGQRC